MDQRELILKPSQVPLGALVHLYSEDSQTPIGDAQGPYIFQNRSVKASINPKLHEINDKTIPEGIESVLVEATCSPVKTYSLKDIPSEGSYIAFIDGKLLVSKNLGPMCSGNCYKGFKLEKHDENIRIIIDIYSIKDEKEVYDLDIDIPSIKLKNIPESAKLVRVDDGYLQSLLQH